MRAQFLLELKKNRLLFVGLAGLFWASLALAVLGYRLAGQPAGQGLAAAFAFWTLAGIPGMALLFGASGGAALRSEAESRAEETFPLSPRRRVLASLAADSLHVLLLAVMIVLVAFLLGPEWRSSFVNALPDRDLLDFTKLPDPTTRAFFEHIGFTSAYLCVLGLSLAYWSRSGVLGGVLALVAGGPAVAVVTAAAGLNMFSDYKPFAWVGAPMDLAVLAAALFGSGSVVSWAALRARPRPLRLLGALASLLAGPLLTPALYWRSCESAQVRLVRCVPEAPRLLPAARKAAVQGLLLASDRGDIVFIAPDGRRRLLHQGHARPLETPPRYHDDPARDHHLAFDRDGSLWVLRKGRRMNYMPELLHGTLDAGLSPASVPPPPSILGYCGPDLGFSIWEKGWWTFAALREKGSRLDWQERVPEWKSNSVELKAWVKAGEAAALDPGGRRLSFTDSRGRRAAWKLPGKPLWNDHPIASPALPYILGGRRTFLVNVELSTRSWALAVCGVNDPVKTVWPSQRSLALETLPDGTVWALGDGERMLLALPDGTFLPPVDLQTALEKTGFAKRGYALVHQDGRTGWLFVSDGDIFTEDPFALAFAADSKRACLVKFDIMTGALLGLQRLPDPGPGDRHRPADYVHVAESCLFYGARGRLYSFTWSGELKDLGAL